jgi:hypothetical protein
VTRNESSSSSIPKEKKKERKKKKRVEEEIHLRHMYEQLNAAEECLKCL